MRLGNFFVSKGLYSGLTVLIFGFTLTLFLFRILDRRFPTFGACTQDLREKSQDCSFKLYFSSKNLSGGTPFGVPEHKKGWERTAVLD
jgi:hypothetical protein